MLLIILTYFTLLKNLMIGLAIVFMSLIPLIVAIVNGINPRRLAPDFIFGSIDTGLMILAVLIGASQYGILGAIAGGVVGDSITDGIAGFFEGSIAKRFREEGIDSSRLPLSSSLGKMSGCLFGGGIILIIAMAAGVNLTG